MTVPDNEESELHSPDLTEREMAAVEKRIAVSAPVVHEAIRQEGEDELSRTTSALAWSGLAAGLSMGFSLVAEGLLRAYLPEAAWSPLVYRLGYSVGFLLVIVGRQQLFTENTLTPIIPLLARRNWRTFLHVLRLWSIVLLTNLIGALAFAWAMGNTGLFEADIKHSFTALGMDSLRGDFGLTLFRGIFAGWLIALMVWMLVSAREGRTVIILIVTYIVALGGFSHVIAGSVSVLYLVTTGALGWDVYFGSFLIPALIGNIVGGVSLVAVVNHAQVVAGGGKIKDWAFLCADSKLDHSL